jgi:EAL domain-containing protein (putative c-di-GMP-specific phosphodiesterase class I)
VVVLHTALHDVLARQDAGHRVQVAVNVDAGVLASADFVPTVLRLLDRHSLPPATLCLELTESELLAPSGPGLLERLRDEGLAVALDDFGTGYSSLAYLADLRLDRLKLDQAFVRRMGADERAARLLRHVVALVHDLGCAVVAEGVETPEEDAVLRALGVDWQQGYLHGRPAPAQALTERLSS